MVSIDYINDGNLHMRGKVGYLQERNQHRQAHSHMQMRLSRRLRVSYPLLQNVLRLLYELPMQINCVVGDAGRVIVSSRPPSERDRVGGRTPPRPVGFASD